MVSTHGSSAERARSLQSLDDFWQLDLATDTWMQITAPGDWPSARTSYAIAFFDGGVYLVGGHDVSSVQRSVWRASTSHGNAGRS